MAELKWVKHPATRVELMTATSSIAMDVMGQGRFVDHMRTTIDLEPTAVAIFADEWVKKYEDNFQEMFDGRGLIHAVGFAWALGFIAGAYYNDLDDHTWREDDEGEDGGFLDQRLFPRRDGEPPQTEPSDPASGDGGS